MAHLAQAPVSPLHRGALPENDVVIITAATILQSTCYVLTLYLSGEYKPLTPALHVLFY